MPFTPVHLGPGTLLKACLGAHFSFVVFGGAQVLTDIEPLIQMMRGASVLHGHSHSIGGAVVIGIIATGLGKPIGEWFLRLIQVKEPHISWAASAAGAFLGTFSHILIDGIMHSDMAPWLPFTTNNHLLGLVSVQALHYLCLASGVIGLIVLTTQVILRNKAS